MGKLINKGKPSLASCIKRCQADGKTVLSINIFDYISFRALAHSFSGAGHPVIAQCSSRLFKQYAPSEVVAWREALKLRNVWLHLDHCEDIELLKRCVIAGFDSVMYDGSSLPLAENIKRSKAAVSSAKRLSPTVLVECEIGHVHGVEDGFGSDERVGGALKVDDVLAFYDAVSPDLLAVGFGNMHGQYKGDEVFDLKLMAAVAKKLPSVPLVLHGGSGMALPLVRKLIGWGHCKLNISTDLKHFWMGMLQGVASVGTKYDSPLAVTNHMQREIGVFFNQLQKKYKSCLL